MVEIETFLLLECVGRRGREVFRDVTTLQRRKFASLIRLLSLDAAAIMNVLLMNIFYKML
jgi:hypothetical protein